MRGVPTHRFAPVVRRIVDRHYDGEYTALCERAKVAHTHMDCLLRERNATFDFNAADRILCAANAIHLWWGELSDVYYAVELETPQKTRRSWDGANRKTVCINGHIRTPETTKTRKDGRMECLICARARANEYRARKREKLAA